MDVSAEVPYGAMEIVETRTPAGNGVLLGG